MTKKEHNPYISSYKKVSYSKNPYKTYALVNDLSIESLGIDRYSLGEFVGQDQIENLEKLIRQILVSKCRQSVHLEIIRHFAGDTDKKTIPLPHSWLLFLQEKGVLIDKDKSIKAFKKQQFRYFLSGCKTVLQCVRNSFAGHSESPLSDQETTIINAPENIYSNDRNKFNFINWIKKNKILKSNTVFNIQNTDFKNEALEEMVYSRKFIFPKLSLLSKIQFFLNATNLTMKCFFKWRCGYWFAPLILSDLVTLEYFKRVQSPSSSYLFSNSHFIIRPLWTYLTEERQCNVTLFFYSTNMSVFYKNQKEHAPNIPGYKTMTWPEIWVCDDVQKTILKDNVEYDATYKITGLVDYTDNNKPVPKIEKSISIFDITPSTKTREYMSGYIAPMYSGEMVSQFIDDVVSTCIQNGIHVIWKQKRDRDKNNTHPSYFDLIEKYKANPYVHKVDSGISARRLIKETMASISIPYTSTAIIGTKEEKPSIYYDSTAELTIFENLSRDIPVIQGKECLEKWVKDLVEKN